MQADAVQMSEISGPQQHILAVVKALRARGHHVRMVAIQNGKTLWSDDLVSWEPCRFGFSTSFAFRTFESILRGVQSRLRLPFLRLFDSYRFSDACVSELGGFDVIYERYAMLSYGGLIAAKRLRIPLVLELNGDLVTEYKVLGINLSSLQWSVYHLITSIMFCVAEGIVVTGEEYRKAVLREAKHVTSKVRLIQNGSNLADIRITNDRLQIQSKYGVGAHQVIAFLGGFYAWQGLDTLLTAFATVHREIPSAQLVLIGDGPERQTIEKTISQLDLQHDVVLTGFRPLAEVAELLSLASIAVAPYKWPETTGLKIFDYMAAGKPIIASAFGARHSVLEHLVTGFLVRPGDADDLANAMMLLLNDESLRSILARNALVQARDKYTWDHTAAEIENICRYLTMNGS